MDKQKIFEIAVAVKSDPNAFEEIIAAYNRKIFAYVSRYMNVYDDAYDVAQEVFVKVYKNIDKYDGRSSFDTWIYKIASNMCIDELRKKKRRGVFSFFDKNEGENVVAQNSEEDKQDNSDIVREAIDELPPKQKQVIVLKVLEEKKLSEIADILDSNIGTVKANVFKAMKNLREILERKGISNESL